MSAKKKGFEEVEALLQDIGTKIEHLIEKGTHASGEAKEEIEQKIKDLKEKKTSLEAEFQKGKKKVEKLYKDEVEPNFQESKGYFKEGFRQILKGINTLFGKK